METGGNELLSGNEAVVRGALAAGLGFFSGYPITPASEIMHGLVKEGKIEFLHADDELAAINMCIGASLSGVRFTVRSISVGRTVSFGLFSITMML